MGARKSTTIRELWEATSSAGPGSVSLPQPLLPLTDALWEHVCAAGQSSKG
jgi:hypothetical protein